MTDTEFYELAAGIVLSGMDTDTNIIEHHGVKGQQWGRRRYQNPDGSLTEAGKKRYKSFEEKKKEWAKDPKKVQKHSKHFTAEEISKAADKQNAQNELNRAIYEEKAEERMEKAAKQQHKDEIRAQKAQEKIERLRIKSDAKVKIVTEETKLALQKQRDIAQAKREEVDRKQKKLEESKKGKTLLARLQKAEKMGKTITGTFETAQKYFKSIGKEEEFQDWWRSLFGQDQTSKKKGGET